LWVFETAPLASRPQPTPSQRFSNSWAFAGGPGVILVAQYDDAPLLDGKTSYNELVRQQHKQACAKGTAGNC
jgi:hypothetical protein